MSDLLIAPPEPIQAAPEPLRAIVLARPFSLERQILRLPQGLRLHEILLEAGIPPDAHARVFIDDWLIPREMWHIVRPRAGRIVTVRVMAQGGGGGQGGQKSTGRIVGMIAIAILAVAASLAVPILAPGFAAAYPVLTGVIGAVAAAAVTIGGNLLLNALIPIQTPKLDALSQPDTQGLNASPSYSLQGARNRMAVYGKVPRVYGSLRYTPPYGAEPVTEIIGNDQYLSLVFCLGYGPLVISDARIGHEPLASFEGVEMEVRQGYPSDPPLTLYKNDVHEEPLSLPLREYGILIRTTQPGTERISVDIAFPRGLGEWSPTTGHLEPYTLTGGVTIRFNTRILGQPFWNLRAEETFTGPTREAFRRTYVTPDLTPGTYEVMVSRDYPKSPDQNVLDDAYWTALRSSKFTQPITMRGLALVALRIKASEQIQGIVDTFNVFVDSILPHWTGAAWVEQPTADPAAVFRNVLQGTATRSPVADSRLNLGALQEWSGFCQGKDYTFNGVIDYETTVSQVLDDVAAVGLARKTLDSAGRYSVVRDVVQTTPIQLFTPRNSWGFAGRKAFPDRPHGFRVRYVDGNGDGEGGSGPASDEASWEIDEVTVYAQGYNASNATRFESLEFRGVTRAFQAANLAKYHHRVVELRPEIWEISCDVENLVCTRGDLVRVAHDVIQAGLGWGRIKSVTIAGPNATGYVVDEEILTEIGKTYQIMVRGPLGDLVAFGIVPTGTVTTTVTFTSPHPSGTVGLAGDLFSWGETGMETIAALVQSILPGQDLTARLTLVPYDDHIYDYDTDEPFPPYVPQISRGGIRPPWQRPGPPAPVTIYSVQADETVMLFGSAGQAIPRILASIRYIPNTGAPSQAAEFARIGGQYRLTESGEDGWVNAWSGPGTATIAEFIGPLAFRYYDIRLIVETAEGWSTWTEYDGIYVVGRVTPPPDVPLFIQEGLLLRWAYPDRPVDFWGFEIRRQFTGDNRAWATAQPMHDGLIPPSAPSYWTIPASGVAVTYFIKALNTSGLESANAAEVTVPAVDLSTPVVTPGPVTVQFGDRLVENLVQTVDYQAASYPGTVTGGSILAGDLVANSSGLYWHPDEGALFWPADDAALFWATQYAEMEYVFSILPDADAVPSVLTLQLEVTGAPHWLEYRTSGTELFWPTPDATLFWGADADLFWPAMGTGWLPWTGILVGILRQVYEFRIRTMGGAGQGVIGFCTIVIDVPDIRESFAGITIAAGTGTRLPITKTYRVIKIVHGTCQATGAGGISVRIEDKGTGGPPLTAGPLLKVLDAAGTAVAGLADAEIIGY